MGFSTTCTLVAFITILSLFAFLHAMTGTPAITGYVMSFVAYEIDKAKITGLIIGKRSIIATLFALDVIMNITFYFWKKKVLFLCFETLLRNTYLMPKNT